MKKRVGRKAARRRSPQPSSPQKPEPRKDLIALVADVQQEKTLLSLLTKRQPALGIRPITLDIYRHPRKDPGVFGEAANFLSPYHGQYHSALVLLDSAWDGAPRDAAFQQQDLQQRLAFKGWPAPRGQVIVIDPELEVWVWADSPAVPEVLRTSWEEIHRLGQERGDWQREEAKPRQPKALLEAILRQQRRPRSSALFQQLAEKVGLDRCQDPAFLLLRQTLANWFPRPPT